MNSENPKHKNSKFLKFLLKLNHGAYELQDDKLVKNEEKMAEFRTTYTEMRNKWQKEEIEKAAAREEVKEEEPSEGTFKDILEGKQELTDDKMQEMMTQWMQEAG